MMDSVNCWDIWCFPDWPDLLRDDSVWPSGWLIVRYQNRPASSMCAVYRWTRPSQGLSLRSPLTTHPPSNVTTEAVTFSLALPACLMTSLEMFAVLVSAMLRPGSSLLALSLTTDTTIRTELGAGRAAHCGTLRTGLSTDCQGTGGHRAEGSVITGDTTGWLSPSVLSLLSPQCCELSPQDVQRQNHYIAACSNFISEVMSSWMSPHDITLSVTVTSWHVNHTMPCSAPYCQPALTELWNNRLTVRTI